MIAVTNSRGFAWYTSNSGPLLFYTRLEPSAHFPDNAMIISMREAYVVGRGGWDMRLL